ncbi:hypothetical protein IJG22_03375 [Candidatus Saccharibacteria bacterium]|nr:hypothetical protein [Candidatus Saccharibacteria bacterium]
MDNNTTPDSLPGQTKPTQTEPNVARAGKSQISPNNKTFDTKPCRLHSAVIGAVAAAVGLAAGIAGTYAITKFIHEPAPCPECKCPTLSDVTSNVNFSFLKLESNQQNLVYSPLSIRNGLALLSAGASGNTKTEIDTILGDEAIPEYQNDSQTSLANAVFIRDTFKNDVLPSYTSQIQTQYDGEVIYDTFDSSQQMDDWVSNKTFNLINNIGIKPSPGLTMVLANALAIQLDWEHQFNSNNTHGEEFTKHDGAKTTVTMMNQHTAADDIKYFIDDNIQSITMPLKATADTELEFTAILPSDGLDNYVKNASTSDIESIINNSISASTPEAGVAIQMPKFKYDYKLKFEDDLKAMGMQTAFNQDLADFSNMASVPLHVGEAVHKANIDFSEDGIKAAAVTAFAMLDTAAIHDKPKAQPISIIFDHPFLFVIHDKASGTVWFTGTVYEPNLWENDKEAYMPKYDY